MEPWYINFIAFACDLSKNPEPPLKGMSKTHLVTIVEILYAILKSVRTKSIVTFPGSCFLSIEASLDGDRKYINLDSFKVDVKAGDNSKLCQRLWKLLQFVFGLLGKSGAVDLLHTQSLNPRTDLVNEIILGCGDPIRCRNILTAIPHEVNTQESNCCNLHEAIFVKLRSFPEAFYTLISPKALYSSKDANSWIDICYRYRGYLSTDPNFANLCQAGLKYKLDWNKIMSVLLRSLAKATTNMIEDVKSSLNKITYFIMKSLDDTAFDNVSGKVLCFLVLLAEHNYEFQKEFIDSLVSSALTKWETWCGPKFWEFALKARIKHPNLLRRLFEVEFTMPTEIFMGLMKLNCSSLGSDLDHIFEFLLTHSLYAELNSLILEALHHEENIDILREWINRNPLFGVKRSNDIHFFAEAILASLKRLDLDVSAIAIMRNTLFESTSGQDDLTSTIRLARFFITSDDTLSKDYSIVGFAERIASIGFHSNLELCEWIETFADTIIYSEQLQVYFNGLFSEFGAVRKFRNELPRSAHDVFIKTMDRLADIGVALTGDSLAFKVSKVGTMDIKDVPGELGTFLKAFVDFGDEPFSKLICSNDPSLEAALMCLSKLSDLRSIFWYEAAFMMHFARLLHPPDTIDVPVETFDVETVKVEIEVRPSRIVKVSTSKLAEWSLLRHLYKLVDFDTRLRLPEPIPSARYSNLLERVLANQVLTLAKFRLDDLIDLLWLCHFLGNHYLAMQCRNELSNRCLRMKENTKFYRDPLLVVRNSEFPWQPLQKFLHFPPGFIANEASGFIHALSLFYHQFYLSSPCRELQFFVSSLTKEDLKIMQWFTTKYFG